MQVFDVLKQKALTSPKTIVFPEGTDIRILKAAVRLTHEKIIKPILLGKEKEIDAQAQELGLDLKGIKIINPATSPELEKLTQDMFAKRKGKNTLEQVKEMIVQGNYFGTMLVADGEADGMVSGAAHSTANTVRPALQIIKTASGMHRVSGIFVMERQEEKYIFGDCAINIDPDAQTLAEIGYQAAKTAKMVGIDPQVAFLSFSTKGSGKGEMVDKVVQATKIFKAAHPDIPADGELQFDAAFVPSVGKSKAPGSKVAGHANVFIFPELQSGNIGYKMVQRLGKFTAIGPVLQGLAKPVNDLSRGASSQDVYDMAILTAAQAE